MLARGAPRAELSTYDLIVRWMVRSGVAPSPVAERNLETLPRQRASVSHALQTCISSPPASGTGDVRNLGKPVDLAGRYFDEGADEVAFLNITGFRDSPLGDLPMLEVGV